MGCDPANTRNGRSTSPKQIPVGVHCLGGGARGGNQSGPHNKKHPEWLRRTSKHGSRKNLGVKREGGPKQKGNTHDGGLGDRRTLQQ